MDEYGVMHFPLITKRYFRAKKARDGFGAVNVPIGKVSRAFLLMKAQKYKLFGINLRCSYDPSVDGRLMVTLVKIMGNDSQVVSRFLHQSPTS